MKKKQIAKTGWVLLKETFNEFNEDNAIKLSASLSYYTLLKIMLLN